MKHLLAAAPLVVLLALVVAAPASAESVYRGKLEVRHSDDFRHGRGATHWSLVKRGQRRPLRLTGRTRARSGDRVVVRGRRAGHWIEGKVRRRRGASVRKASVLGDRSVAVIPINFTPGDEPWSAQQIRDAIFDGTGSTAAFYKEQSYDDIRLSGDVYGWHTVSGSAATCSFGDVDRWAADARAAAGLTWDSYDHFVYVFPRQSSCGWAGLGMLPGKESWLNGDLSVRVAAHELGHNMGLHHASSLSCTSGGAPVTKSSSCSASEYGDPFDVMGLNARHSGAWHLNKLGVVGSGNVQVASTSGTYTISSALSRRTGPVLLRVPTGSSSSYVYDVEIREDGSIFDNWDATSPVVNGVTLHWNPANSRIEQTMLLDATPGVGGFLDSSLRAGRSFSDGNVTISVTSVSAGQATVEVVRAAAADTRAPTALGSLRVDVAPHTATVGWTAATDDVGVAGYRVYRDDSLIATTAGTSHVDSGVAAGWHKYQVHAYDAAGNSRASSVHWAHVPELTTQAPPPPEEEIEEDPIDPQDRAGADTIAPSVRITAPGNRARLRRGRARIKALAADDRGVSRLEIKVDGRRVAAAEGDRITRTLRRLRRGRHRIVVRAIDHSGNVGKDRIVVRVKRGRRSARHR